MTLNFTGNLPFAEFNVFMRIFKEKDGDQDEGKC